MSFIKKVPGKFSVEISEEEYYNGLVKDVQQNILNSLKPKEEKKSESKKKKQYNPAIFEQVLEDYKKGSVKDFLVKFISADDRCKKLLFAELTKENNKEELEFIKKFGSPDYSWAAKKKLEFED